MTVGKKRKGLGEVIDLDTDVFPNATTAMRRKGKEVIDVDSYAVKDINDNVIDLDSYSYVESIVIDVDIYEDHDTFAKTTKKTKRVISFDDASFKNIYSNATSTFGMHEKDNDEKVMRVTEEAKKAKVVLATKKSSAPLDEWLPDDVKQSHHVLEMGDEIYDAMLTQASVEDSSNKFYVIQVLGANDCGSYKVLTRWGRVGAMGHIKLSKPHSDCNDAIREFEEKFFDKTKIRWSKRKSFVSRPKCYTWLELDYSKKDQGASSASLIDILRRRRLDPRVARFVSLICDMNPVTQQQTELGKNHEKLAFQNLSKTIVSKGYDVLKVIADAMGQANRRLLEELSAEFYTIIPHDFGNKKLSEFAIDTPTKLRKKLELVEDLGIHHATTLLPPGAGMQVDPQYTMYEGLHCQLIPVEAKSKEFSMITKYMQNTRLSNGTVKIVEIFCISREGDHVHFKKYGGTKNRMLLWHGSPLENWRGILSQGLRCNAVRGTYFADMFALSESFCQKTSVNPTGVISLCEVALGEMQESPYPGGPDLLKGKQSLKAVGLTEPSGSEVLEDGVIVPLGKPIQKPYEYGRVNPGGMPYNEYIVFNADRIRIRYVIQLNFR